MDSNSNTARKESVASGEIQRLSHVQCQEITSCHLGTGQSVNPIEKYVSSLSAQKISNEISFALDGGKDDIRARETNLGNLVADSQLWVAQTYAKDKNAPVADVALANGGGIRASINESGTSNYKASVDDTYTVLPFGNIVTVVPDATVTTGKDVCHASDPTITQVLLAVFL